MTVAHYTKILKQLENKPVKKAKFLKHSAVKDRSCGRVKKSCQRCGRTRSIVGQYGINLCRQCFRENATKIGFKQLS